MKMFKNWKIKENVIKVIKMYPVVLCCFFAIGALGILLVHNESIDEDIITKINFSIAVFAGFALVLRALSFRYEKLSKKTHLILLLVCAALSVGYYFTIDIDKEWTIIRTFIILFVEGLLFISLPFIKDDDRCEHFVNLTAGRLVISGLLFGIAYGGVAGILFALEELFGLDITYKAYTDAAIVLATTFLPMLWLFGLDYQVKPSSSKLYRVLLSYVCIPLIFIYSVIVYGFILIKIVFAGFVMPNSIIGNLVLWYSFVSIVVTYLARPYKENSITKFFYRWYPLISVLPIAVMFVAMFMRINQYAITINRYYLLLGGIFLAVMFGYLIFVSFTKKKRLNVITTLLLAFFALVSIIEPVSANSIAESSQIDRLEKIIVQYSDGDTLNTDSMSDEDIEQVQDILYYLDSHHDGYGLQYENYDSFVKNVDFLSVSQANEILELVTTSAYPTDTKEYYYASNTGENNVVNPINVEGYKYFLTIESNDFNYGDPYSLDEYKIKVEELINKDPEITDYSIIIYKDNVLLAELSILECFGDNLSAKKDEFGADYSDFIYETPDNSVKIVLDHIEFWYEEDISVVFFTGSLLLK